MNEPPIRKNPAPDAKSGPDPMNDVKRKDAEQGERNRRDRKIVPLPMTPD